MSGIGERTVARGVGPGEYLGVEKVGEMMFVWPTTREEGVWGVWLTLLMGVRWRVVQGVGCVGGWRRGV